MSIQENNLLFTIFVLDNPLPNHQVPDEIFNVAFAIQGEINKSHKSNTLYILKLKPIPMAISHTMPNNGSSLELGYIIMM